MRLDDVTAHFGDQVLIEWKAFMLRSTEAGRKTRAEFVDYTRNWSRMHDADPRLVVTAPWASPAEHPSHSLPALAAWKLAANFGPEIGEEFHRRMFIAYFGENRTISDLDVIVAIAAESGADPVEFEAGYTRREQPLADQVISDHREALELGISAVPTVIIDDQVAIPGAQDTATYIEVIDEILARRTTMV